MEVTFESKRDGFVIRSRMGDTIASEFQDGYDRDRWNSFRCFFEREKVRQSDGSAVSVIARIGEAYRRFTITEERGDFGGALLASPA